MSFSKTTVFLLISVVSGFYVLKIEAKNPVQAAWHAKKSTQ
ncbi:MAG: hypothetical protein WC707_01990 [Candidatus Babeliaceae bacterium]|jgi:hypothetical protein